MPRPWGAGLVVACALAAEAAAPAGVGAAERSAKARREVRVHLGGGGALGVSLEEVGAADVSRLKLAEERGAVVREVEPDSPAAEAGLEKDDVIVGYQGEAVHSAAQLARLVRETPGGRKVTMDVSRGGALQKLTATLGEGRLGKWPTDLDLDLDIPMPAIAIRPPRPPRAPEPPEPPAELGDFPKFHDFGDLWGRRPRLGLTYQELTDQLAAYFKVEGGLLVTSVNEGSPAALAGIKAGDVIVRLNEREVRSSDDLRGELDRAGAGEEVTVGLQREGRRLEVKAKLAEAKSRTRRMTIKS
jgi:serine protease Do